MVVEAISLSSECVFLGFPAGSPKELESFEGDIILTKFQKAMTVPLYQDSAPTGGGASYQYLWPERTVPYYIPPQLGKSTFHVNVPRLWYIAWAAEIHVFAVRSPRFWISGNWTKGHIQGIFHSSNSRLLNVKSSQETKSLASILSDTFVNCTCRNITVHNKNGPSLDFHWVCTSMELPNTYFRGAVG